MLLTKSTAFFILYLQQRGNNGLQENLLGFDKKGYC